MSIQGNPFIIHDSSLVMHLDAVNTKSYPGSGTDWFDLSGTNNTGSLKNNPTFSSSNTASIIFDGLDDYVQTPLNIDSNPVSIMAWCRPYDVTSLNGRGIVLTDNGGWDKGLEFNNSQWLVHVGNNYAYTGVAATANTWYNCCLVYTASNIFLYVNGILIWTYGSAPGSSAGSTVEIGRANYSAGAGSRFFSGAISVVAIYNRALSSDEVLQNYNAVKSRFGL